MQRSDSHIPHQDPISQTTYKALKEAYGMEMTVEKFLGVCGYLYFVLVGGESLSWLDLDPFICLWPEYHRLRSQLREQQIACADEQQPTIPSYRNWFTTHRNRRALSHGIMTPQKLRTIGKEHPFSFGFQGAEHARAIALRRLGRWDEYLDVGRGSSEEDA